MSMTILPVNIQLDLHVDEKDVERIKAVEEAFCAAVYALAYSILLCEEDKDETGI